MIEELGGEKMVNVRDYMYFKNLYNVTDDPKVFREIGEGIYDLIENTPFFFEVFRHEDLIHEYLKEIIDVLNFKNKKSWMDCNEDCGTCHLYCEKAIDIMYLPFYRGYPRDKKLLDELLENFNDNMLIEKCPNLAIYHLNEVPGEFVKLLNDKMVMNTIVETVAIWMGQVIEWLGSPVDYLMMYKNMQGVTVESDDKFDEERFVVDKDTPIDYDKYRVVPILCDEFYQTYKEHMLELMFEWLLDYKSRDYIIGYIDDNFEEFVRSLAKMLPYYIDSKTDNKTLAKDITEKLRGGY